MHWLRSVHIAIDLTNTRGLPMDYPVMLYRNSFDDWKIADDEEHEEELLSEGYMSHADFKAKDKNDNGALDIAEMEKDDLKALLDERGVKYVSRDTLKDLIQKAKDSE